MTTLVGMLLSDRYRLDAQVGSGGMSTVYRAFDQTLERHVAIKLLHREIADDPAQLERFRREARAVAQLSHPHIVTVIDAGEDEGRPYIVFEYVDGETLKERIKREGPLPVDEALAYAIEIARALGYAHQRHIVHRDVKPQNVLIDEEGSAKVTDFGIARTVDEEGLTADGRVLGTTDYVSPEQAMGHEVTGQSDLYSLGIVLFEMLTGRRPVPRREPGRGRDEARARAAARRAGAAAGGVRDAGRRRRPRDGEGSRPPLRQRHRADRRPRGRAGARERARRRTSAARRRASCARCRRARSAACRCGCAGRGGSRSRSCSPALAVAAVVYFSADHAQRGTGTQGAPKAAPGLKAISLGQNSAHLLRPAGRRDRAPQRDRGGGRPRPEHVVEHRELRQRRC